MMDASFIRRFREKIELDPEYHKSRRDFHENYEWLEGYWNGNLRNIDRFCTEHGSYYWSIEEIRDLARDFAFAECVGNSKHDSYMQTQEISKATMYLRYKAGLETPESGIPDCPTVGCREFKSAEGWCTEEHADLWEHGDHAAFKALMYIVRQIRNNLFHGHKLETERLQYDRNKSLVHTAALVTRIVLENLR